MRVIILGSAAGGGVPQWNCACPNCTDARHDNRGRTQSSVAVSADGERWILLNASPDLRTQLAAHHELWPRGGGPRPPARAPAAGSSPDADSAPPHRALRLRTRAHQPALV